MYSTDKIRRLNFDGGMMELEHITPADLVEESELFVSVLVRFGDEISPCVVRVLAENLANEYRNYLTGRIVMTVDHTIMFNRSQILAVIA